MIKKVLVANRGEIAVRVMRSCREMGILTVAVFSDADRKSMHVRYADEAYHIGPSPSVQSYLNIEKIIEVAKKSGADAIHPGYGFLSENERFAQRCQDEGIIFIGPSPYAISAMGDKITARKHMLKAGVPVVPGTEDKVTSDEEAIKIIQDIGVPVMIKASAGGGGKGMRLVRREDEIIPALRAARSEAATAFGDDAVYIEKYIDSPHHIEFQILADRHGHTIHLFERECSVQRRHQKVIEETPSPAITSEKQRRKMGEAAVRLMKAAGYINAGTVEFIMDPVGNFYFIEVNKRIQVEHPITEMVTGIDIVEEQLRIAYGEPMRYRQKDVKPKGWAMECRINAENPDRGFMPAPGRITFYYPPSAKDVRVDSHIYTGYEVPPDYDSLIAKLIVKGEDRQECIRRMRQALSEFIVEGIPTTTDFCQEVLGHVAFVRGTYNTSFVEDILGY